MNKNELIADVAKRADLTKEQAGAAIEATLDAITDTMKAGEEVRLLGFGNFDVVKRSARMGRNPSTGEPMKIKASKTVRFRPGKALKTRV